MTPDTSIIFNLVSVGYNFVNLSNLGLVMIILTNELKQECLRLIKSVGFEPSEAHAISCSGRIKLYFSSDPNHIFGREFIEFEGTKYYVGVLSS